MTHLTIDLQPVVRVDPNATYPGHSVKVTGSGFGANASIDVSTTIPIYGGGTKTISGRFRTDGKESFGGYLSLPGHTAASVVNSD